MNQRKKFYVYVIQIGNVAEVLFVNFATDVNQAFDKFVRKHSHLRNSVLRADLVDQRGFVSSRKAHQSSLELIDKLESQGYEVIAGGPLLRDYWQAYVIEIDGNPQHLYVGETNYPVEKRFQQHVYKYNPARILLRYNSFELAMHHAQQVGVVTTKKESLIMEATLAEELRQKGYRVEGGH